MKGLDFVIIGLILYSLLSISSCAPVIVAGAATGAVVANDPRTVGAFIDDAAIEMKIKRLIKKNDRIASESHINVTSVNGIVLLSGETPNQDSRNQILAGVRTVNGVKRTVNEMRITSPSGIKSRSHDTWLTSKVKTRLIANKQVDSTRIKVVTENSVVYLMGLIEKSIAESAAASASKVSGVKRIVKLFEYID